MRAASDVAPAGVTALALAPVKLKVAIMDCTAGVVLSVGNVPIIEWLVPIIEWLVPMSVVGVLFGGFASLVMAPPGVRLAILELKTVPVEVAAF
jgi:hypothetical protein